MTAVPADRDRFRLRGTQVTRLETFVDAAFAFSLTLLAIVVDDLPHSIAELRAALRQVPAFVFCFVLLATFWSAHNRWSRRFGLDDARSNVLSLALVLVVMLYVYPLRMVVSGAMGFFSGGWAPFGYTIDAARAVLDLQTMFIVYSIGFGLLAWLVWQLNAHALRLADGLGLDARERAATVTEIGIHVILCASAACSILASVAALLLVPHGARPGWIATLPAWLYALLGPAIGAYVAWRGRRGPSA